MQFLGLNVKKISNFQWVRTVLVGSLLLTIAACDGVPKEKIGPGGSDGSNIPNNKLGAANHNSDHLALLSLNSFVHLKDVLNLVMNREKKTSCVKRTKDANSDFAFLINWNKCTSKSVQMQGSDMVSIYLGSFTEDDFYSKGSFNTIIVYNKNRNGKGNLIALKDSTFVSAKIKEFSLKPSEKVAGAFDFKYNLELSLKNKNLKKLKMVLIRSISLDSSGQISLIAPTDTTGLGVQIVKNEAFLSETQFQKELYDNTGFADNPEKTETQNLNFTLNLEATEIPTLNECGKPMGQFYVNMDLETIGIKSSEQGQILTSTDTQILNPITQQVVNWQECNSFVNFATNLHHSIPMLREQPAFRDR